MTWTEPVPAASHCPRCFLRRELCLCAEVVTVATRTRFLILRHVREAVRATNTGRMAALALRSCTLRNVGQPGPRLCEPLLSLPRTWVLFPDTGSAPPPGEVPQQLVVLDGSWSQARRMLHRIPALHRMPRLALPAPAVTPQRMRRGRLREGMSTLEAMAHAVAALEGEATAAPLHALHTLMVDRVLTSRGRLGRRV